jgi:hypothetical protein
LEAGLAEYKYGWVDASRWEIILQVS